MSFPETNLQSSNQISAALQKSFDTFSEKYPPVAESHMGTTDFIKTSDLTRMFSEHTGIECSSHEVYELLHGAGYRSTMVGAELVWLVTGSLSE